jgi:hypothetical protein
MAGGAPPTEEAMDPRLQRAILDLRDELDAADHDAFEADIRTAFSLPSQRREPAVEVVLRSWRSRQELQAAPAASWFS